MKSRNSKSGFMDKKVFWSMAICAAISLTVLAFRIKNHEPCNSVEISVKPGPLYVGEMIQFKAMAKPEANNIQWDFGDERKNGTIVNHTFDMPGRYEVFLNTDTQCSGYKTIYVMEAPIVEDENLKVTFTGPLTVEVGAAALFEDVSPNATKWEWRFGETNGIDATKQRVTYTFRTPGPKTVILVVNDQLQGELEVLVTPQAIKNPEKNTKANNNSGRNNDDQNEILLEDRKKLGTIQDPEVEIEKVESSFPDVSLRQLEIILEGIVEGKKTIKDLSFYTCEGEAMLVTYNGELVDLNKLKVELWEIKSKKKIRKIEITTKKDPIKNCIITMDITLKKKWL